MNLFPSHIKLNGKLVTISDLLDKRTSKEAEWEKEWLDFLAEWYNDKNYIEVNTSGSTGHPKTIRLKKDFIAASAHRTIHYFRLKKNDQILHCLPTKYIAGKLMVIRALLGDLDVSIVDPATDFLFLKKQHFKFAAMVPNQVHKLLEFKACNLEFLLIGGSAVSQTLIGKLQNLSTQCYSSYAMTETATHIALRKLNGVDRDEYYHCLENIHVQLSPDNCLEIFMPGLEQPLTTTDIAKLKDDKTFQIMGRADHVIISGGIKFSPEQIEKKLDPFISQPFVISSETHETLGKQIILILEGEEEEPKISRLKTIVEQQLVKYERPKQIRFVQKLPRTENGKINRKAL